MVKSAQGTDMRRVLINHVSVISGRSLKRKLLSFRSDTVLELYNVSRVPRMLRRAYQFVWTILGHRHNTKSRIVGSATGLRQSQTRD